MNEAEHLRFELSRLYRAWDELEAYREVTAALISGDITRAEAKAALEAEGIHCA